MLRSVLSSSAAGALGPNSLVGLAARAFTTSAALGERVWNVYLSGEIHTDWRDQIVDGVKGANLPVHFDSPNLSHEDSDDCGAVILGDETKRQWYDMKGASINALRTRTLLDEADIAVVRFGQKYRQWNAAFDAGYATARGIPVITLHDTNLEHPLKEVNAEARARCETPEQVVQVLSYVIKGTLPPAPAGFEPMVERIKKETA